MEIHGSAISIPIEQIPLLCGGFILLMFVAWLYVKIRQAIAPHKEIVYYATPSFLRQDD